MGFYDAFFGSDQSLYTAYAIIAAIISICVTILFTSTDIPIGSRLLMILFVVITLVPSIFLTLFEITCIVTGGTEPNNWWCYTFAWILAAFIIIYCIFVVIISIVSLVTYNKAIDNVNNDEEKNKVNPNEANEIAKQIMATQKPIEKFYDGGSADISSMMQQYGGNASSLIKNFDDVLTQNNLQPPNNEEKENNIAHFYGAMEDELNSKNKMANFTDYNSDNMAHFGDLMKQPSNTDNQKANSSQLLNNNIGSFADISAYTSDADNYSSIDGSNNDLTF
jgi:uncharacterized membrane protein